MPELRRRRSDATEVRRRHNGLPSLRSPVPGGRTGAIREPGPASIMRTLISVVRSWRIQTECWPVAGSASSALR
jgi:hypothetical protein